MAASMNGTSTFLGLDGPAAHGIMPRENQVSSFWLNLISQKQQDDLANASTPRVLKLMERRQEAKRLTQQRQAQDKRRWDALAKTQQLEVNDLVLFRLENPFGLEPLWFGPYKVAKRNLETDI